MTNSEKLNRKLRNGLVIECGFAENTKVEVSYPELGAHLDLIYPTLECNSGIDPLEQESLGSTLGLLLSVLLYIREQAPKARRSGLDINDLYRLIILKQCEAFTLLAQLCDEIS